ncbi:protein PAL OF QUIRKY-like [Corylus avellana]|uniref:protein PAL OF QUIRKY-like n=1 Tax=Corylus avellana TaxID=13451 RepID=UPI00286BED7E|nr:protein PAL OF QUIRKY-like [Corylus avellana]
MESNRAAETIKFLCSYGGKILPRYTDGELRYVGGLTRVLAVDRSISFAELMVKLGEFCGYSVNLRCQLPSGDLETLISISSDEDLANLVEEYDRASSLMSHPLKIRAVLSPPTSLKKISPPPSMTPSVNFSMPGSPFVSVDSLKNSSPYRFVPRNCLPAVGYPAGARNCSGKAYRYSRHVQDNPRVSSPYYVPHCNYWH